MRMHALIGINVNSRELPYADWIVNGEKRFESRDSNSLGHCIGRRVAIVRTGGKAVEAIGEVLLGPPIVVDEEQFRLMEPIHLVPKDSRYDVPPGGIKYLYPLYDPVRYEQPLPVSYGVVTRQVLTLNV